MKRLHIQRETLTSTINAPVDATATAARFIQREWGEESGYWMLLLGAAPRSTEHDQPVYVWEVCHSGDGSRFLVWADQWGNYGQVDA